MKTLERCFNERIDRERSNIIDTVEDRTQNAILTAIENIIAPKIELAIRSENASSGADVASVSVNSERGEQVGISAPFESASGSIDTLGVSKVNDETRNNFADEVSELSVPETHFDRQPHTHHMVTGRTAQTNQFPEFLTGRILTPRNPPSHQYQKLSTQVSEDNNLPVVEQTPRQNSDATISKIFFVNCGLESFLKGQSYLEMRTLSPILILGFLKTRTGLLYRMDKKSDFFTFFGIKSIEQILLELVL